MSGNEAAQSSLDGKGRTETKLKSRDGRRYIYYRLYTRRGALESNNPIYSNDRFISRTLPKSVPPAHTAASLKKHLCKIEGLEVTITCSLYLSLSERTPVEGSLRLSLRGTHGPGESELDPLALVVIEASDAGKRSRESWGEVKDLLEWPGTRSYIYYRLYDDGSDIPSNTSFDETDSSLGRIDALLVPPPRTVASLKYFLAHAEAGSMDGGCKLFEDEGAETTMNDGDVISLLFDSYPGISREEPIAIVLRTPWNRRALQGSLKRSLIADYDSRWHTMTMGEIFHTDGVLIKKPFMSDDEMVPCYDAINSAGKKAFVESCCISFC